MFESDEYTHQLRNLKRKAESYQEVLRNTEEYREIWKENFKQQIINALTELMEKLELTGKIQVREQMENLEAIYLTLGKSQSGMYTEVSEGVERHLIKHNGTLIYQQLFNGKIIVLVQYPYIEGYGKPKQPKTIAIYRPEELKPPFFIRHMETFLNEVTMWEDYDDDEPHKRIGFELNFGDTTGEEDEEEQSKVS